MSITSWPTGRVSGRPVPDAVRSLLQHHEPTNYYGVQRNFVETLIIPSTWREGGVKLSWHHFRRAHVDVGLTSGVNMNSGTTTRRTQYRTLCNWESASGRWPPHQELSLANGRTCPSTSRSIGGVPGLVVGAAVSTGLATIAEQVAG
jgi:hypothetical protein